MTALAHTGKMAMRSTALCKSSTFVIWLFIEEKNAGRHAEGKDSDESWKISERKADKMCLKDWHEDRKEGK